MNKKYLKELVVILGFLIFVGAVEEDEIIKEARNPGVKIKLGV